MFTIQCTTCNAKLSVKNEELIGQILACPKCDGMVLIQPPNITAPSFDELPQPFKKFPEAFVCETPSGIIGTLNESETENPVPPTSLPPLSESEIRTRKIMVGALLGLLLLLVVAVGVLIVVKGQQNTPLETDKPQEPMIAEPFAESFAENIPEQIQEPQHPNENPPSEPETLIEPEQSDSGTAEQPEMLPVSETKIEDASEKLADLLEKTPPEIRTTTDLLSDIEKKLPGLVKPTAALTIDIPSRLAIPLAGLKLEKTPLLNIVRKFSDLTEIPITLDVDELRPRGIQIDTPITASFEAGTIGETLTKILAQLELEPVIEDRQILITVSPERRNNISERKFDVADFAEKTEDLKPERLVEILQRLVFPAEQDAVKSVIKLEGNSIIVQNSLRMLDESLRVLEQLRVVRQLPQKTEVIGENLVPEAFGWDAMVAPMTLNYYRPTLLSGVLVQLESVTKLRILVDHKALHRAFTPFSTIKAAVLCNRGTVNEAIEKLLASVDVAMLTYRIVGHDVLEITTHDAARQPNKMSIEVHRYELGTNETLEELAKAIRLALEPNSWFIPDDPETIGFGDIIIDHLSSCLLIRQSQPVQRQIRLWLGKKQNAADTQQTSI